MRDETWSKNKLASTNIKLKLKLFYKMKGKGCLCFLSSPLFIHFKLLMLILAIIFLAAFAIGASSYKVSTRRNIECPAVDGVFPVYLEHESDCRLFYECSNGVKHLLSCPQTLYFNIKINVCDYPENVSCRNQECPAVDGPFPVYLPHPTNCNLFYECSNGIKYLMSCPAQLHFNVALNVCDYPQNAGCKNSSPF